MVSTFLKFRVLIDRCGSGSKGYIRKNDLKKTNPRNFAFLWKNTELGNRKFRIFNAAQTFPYCSFFWFLMLKFLGILVRKFNCFFFFVFLELFLDLCHNGYGSAALMPGPVLRIRIRMEPELFRIRIRTYIFGSGSGNFIWMYQHMEVRINKRKREEKKNYAPVDLRLYIP